MRTIVDLPTLTVSIHDSLRDVAAEACPTSLLVLDDLGAILYSNPRISAMFGHTPDELVGRSVETILPASQDSSSGPRFWFRSRSRQAATTRELRGARKDGSELAVEVAWTRALIDGRRLTVASVIDISERRLRERQSQADLEHALAEVERLRDRLAEENVQLRHEVIALQWPRAIAAESESIQKALAQVELVAGTDSTVLLLGETGCGKEVFAQAIHDLSRRRDRPMVRVNCAAIPTALIESELFGRERGAYTGALSRQLGRFELASGTTIFLDEVGDLPLEAQVKLLHILQDRTLERLGSTRPIHVDVRVIAATNRDLKQAVADRTFREDLFYRLNVFPIPIPPLRERTKDIPVLTWSFIDEFSKAFNRSIESISRESLAALQRHSWPGNVRELRNVIERAVILAKGPVLAFELPCEEAATPAGHKLEDRERHHIRDVLERAGWRIRGVGGAAEILGIKPTTLESRMVKLGIRRPKR